ncbi:hypothetical protein LQR31_03315 [Chromobacterium vaccinii]|uniref:hypothetical protein n=1 Tax=Chromobacterium vaccinii TaxID=1108595 RepID=UPI001E56ABCE|nr:hypothetical protein [Chromobacterium vaccinii]MCD4483501.1 hypothetical protein [Chromobacterium vaccinii]
MMRFPFLPFVFAALLGGCATIGNVRLQDADNQDIRQLLLRQDAAASARDRLQTLLGQPDDRVRLATGREVWVYRSDKYQPKWQNFTNVSPLFRSQSHQTKELVVLFSTGGQALQWRLLDDSRDEDTGLVNRALRIPTETDKS